jgi:hypothetical protein
MSFDTLNLHETLSRALAAAGYTEPTSVQAEAIPAALAGKDLMVSSRTGSGKTASFVLPALTLVLKAREQQRAAQAQAQQAAAPQDGQTPQAPRAPRAHRDDGFRSGPRPFVKPRGPLGWLDPGVFGTLGVGAGFALGAKLVRPDADVWLLWGDGAAGFSLIELDTFARHGVPVIAVVGNDAGWTQIERDQVVILGDDVACRLTHMDYHVVAEACGGEVAIKAHGIGRFE